MSYYALLHAMLYSVMDHRACIQHALGFHGFIAPTVSSLDFMKSLVTTEHTAGIAYPKRLRTDTLDVYKVCHYLSCTRTPMALPTTATFDTTRVTPIVSLMHKHMHRYHGNI